MSEQKFAMIRDADGDAKDATIAQFPDLQGEGYRIADVAAYQAAVAASAAPQPEPAPNVGAETMAEQGRVDAAEATAEQFPEAKPAAADKPKARKA